MIWIEWVYNLSLIVSISVVSGFVDTRWDRDTRKGQLLQGMLFGAAAMIGMLRPFVFAPGLVFDGRSVVISLGALFFGPLAATIMCAMTIPLRMAQGGVGTIPGVVVIVVSATIGVLARRRPSFASDRLPAARLWIFGLVVHAAMLAAMLTLPTGMVVDVLSRITLPVIGVYPLATILVGKVLSDQAIRRSAIHALHESEARFRSYVEHSPYGVFVADGQGRYLDVNPASERLTGYSARQLATMRIPDLIAPEGQDAAAAHFQHLMQTGEAQGEFPFVRADGSVGQWTVDAVRVGPDRFLGFVEDITGRRHAEDRLALSEEKYRVAFMTSPDSININRLSDGLYIDINAGFERIMGYTREDVIGHTSTELHIWKNPEDRKRLVDDLRENGYVANLSAQFSTADGTIREGLMSACVIDLEGEPCILSITRDITNIKALESQLSQAQKMEAVGRLAGGVAHDFNNMIMGVMGYAELCREKVGNDSQIREWLNEIICVVQRSANLTRQLLAFARKQTVAPQRVDLNEVVESMLNMLRQLIGEDIELAWKPGADICPVKIDPGQLDQILANLCVNARDAISGVGKVTIETGNVILDEAYCATHARFNPGEFAMLAVSDDGCGMDRETLDNVFEPFFTTKGVGQGTGLGMATVYGIVEQNGGVINAYSEPGKGTTFKVYLRRHAGDMEKRKQADRTPACIGGRETILLVEDERSIRVTIRLFLESLGYTVLSADSPKAALAIAAAHVEHIDLLITDVVMPGMHGRELAERLAKDFKSMKILYMSGYTANIIAHRGVREKDVPFMSKPISREMLAHKVRSVLDG